MKDFIRRHWDEILGWIGVALILGDLYRNGWWIAALGLMVGLIGATHIIRTMTRISLKRQNREENEP